MDKHSRTPRALWNGLLVSMLLAGLSSGCAQPTPDAAEVARELAAIYATQTAQAQAAATPIPTSTPLPEDAVVIPDTTQVLAEAELANLTSISEDLTVFTFAGSSEQIASLQQNDVIVGDVSDQAPDGFLRRVESVTSDGGQVIVHTSPARLEDAIDTGALAVTEDLMPADVRAGWKRPGVELASLAPPALPSNWHVTLANVVLFDLDGDTSTTRDQVRANGALDFTTRLDFNLKMAWFRIERLSVVASAEETADIRISGNVTLLGVQEEVQVAYFPLNPITFMIGPVPVVLTPILTVNVGLDGTAHAGFVASVTQSFSASAGVRYENKRWQPIARFENDFDYQLPQVTGNLQVGAYGSVQLAVLIYGVGGPWASLDGNFGLDVNIQRSPPWRLYGGLRCRAGVRAEILGYKLGNFAQTVIDTRIPIAEGSLSIATPPTATWTPTRPSPTWTPSPAPSATRTPSPTPSATWTPSPTPSATWTPSPTPSATWTPSPTPSPTRACAIATDPALAPAWELGSLGCPTAASAVVWSAWQPFEHGSMFWRNDLDWTYVLDWQDGTNTARGNWATGGDAWKWDGSFPDGRGLTPPAGRVEPVRGFGLVWFDKLGGPASAIGWATAQEKGFCATIQPFARGVIFRSNPTSSCQDQLFNWATDPSFPPLFVTLFADGTWQRR